MRNQLILVFSFIIFSVSLSAQLTNGSIAPDFTAKDINGNTYNLYDILAEGKSVVLDFSATWCGPCWSYHNTHSLGDYMGMEGPEGTDEAMVFYVESDITTTQADLEGTGSNTVGDWITGTNYPILDQAFIASMYQVGSYPTILMVCPDRRLQNVGRPSPTDLSGLTKACPSIEVAPEPSFYQNQYVGCNALDVQFEDTSWPRADAYFWDFGDGNTSTERNPLHTYSEAGNYSIKLDVISNEFGTSTIEKKEVIKIGTGNSLSNQNIGPMNKDVGSGRYFEGGHQALIFDAENDFVLSTVKVFSSKDADRTIVLIDDQGELIGKKNVFIPEGEQIVELDLFVPQGVDYRLGLHSDAYLYRNDGGISYPYSIDNLVTITESTASTDPLRYYYYFYDWEVREVGCDGLVGIEDQFEESIKFYPNPASDFVMLEGNISSDQKVNVFNLIGQLQQVKIDASNNSMRVDISNLNTGIYFLNIGTESFKLIKE